MNPKPQQPAPSSPGEFVPEKISIAPSRRGRRRGGHQADIGGDDKDTTSANVDVDGGHQQQQQQAISSSQLSQSSAISSSVVFHEDCELFDEIDDLYPHDYEGGKVVADPHTSTSTATYSHSRSSRSDSVSDGGGLLSSSYQQQMLQAQVGRPRSNSNLSASRSTLASSLLQSLQNSNLGASGNYVIPTDVDSLMASSNDGTLAGLIAGIEDRYKASTTLSQASVDGSSTLNLMGKCKRDSIVGGKQISDMSFAEQRELLAPERSDNSLKVDLDDRHDGGNNQQPQQSACYRYSPTITSNSDDGKSNNIIVSSVDWSSLCKSCKRAKNAFRDPDSGQMVVKNMFLTHLSALTTVLTLYAKRYCGNERDSESENNRYTLDEIMARTKETKRALRFGMSCLAPPRVEEDSNVPNEEGGHDSGNEAQDGIDRFRISRRYRQELQDAAVKGFTSMSPPNEGEETIHRRGSMHYYGLQIPLGEIINADDRPDAILSVVGEDVDNPTCATIMASIVKEKRAVRVLAARMLCNLVTDNPLAAEIVLRDVPFSPDPDLIESQLASSILGSRERADMSKTITKDDDKVLFWSDLIASTAKVQASDSNIDNSKGKKRDDSSDDREALAAVAAALHNLLTSLEARESLLELEHEMKRREDAKREQLERATSHRRDTQTGVPSISEVEVDSPTSMKPIDVGFEVATNGPLLNSLLRNILPAKAVLRQSQLEREHLEKSRPRFKPPESAKEDLADSATEWISLILERLASRGLLHNMLLSAGGSVAVTPEQVVLVSCIRQAVDDYHSALTPSGENGEFGRRRLSIAAKTAGMTMTTRPHPLWGRANLGSSGRAIPGRDSRTAVPVLLTLANEVEEIRLRSNDLREGDSSEMYDGEGTCTIRIIDDLCDILAQCLGRHAASSPNSKQCFLADARSVLGRETTLISSCCKDLARILDSALESNAGRKAREMMLSAQDQQTAIVMVRMIGNLVYQCRYNQDLLRITPVPMPETANDKSVSSNSTGARSNPNSGAPADRTGLHIILSATSLSPACFTLREWCIVAIRNAIENNAANAETVRRLEANQVLDDTPELRRIGVKIDMDAHGNVQVKRRD